MTNPKRGEVEIQLNGQSYLTKLNLDSLMRIETATGQSILRTAQNLPLGEVPTQHVVFILQTAIKGGGTDIKDAAMKQLIWEAGLTEALTACGEILTRVIVGEDDDEGNGKKAE